MQPEIRPEDETPFKRNIRRMLGIPKESMFMMAGGQEFIQHVHQTFKIDQYSAEALGMPIMREFHVEASKSLPPVLEEIIDSTSDTNWTNDDRKLNVLIWSMLLPPKAKELEEAWCLLNDRLETSREAIFQNPEPSLRIFLLADALFYRAALPPEEKYRPMQRSTKNRVVYKEWVAQQMDLILQSEPGDGIAYEKLDRSLQAFKMEIERLSNSGAGKNEVCTQLRFLDCSWKMHEESTIQFWLEYGSVASEKWLDGVEEQLEDVTLESPFLAQLFSERILDGTHPDLLAILWAHLWTRQDQDEMWHADDRLAYFFDQEPLQKSFWSYFFSSRLEVDQSKWLFPQDITATRLPWGMEAFTYIFGQNEEVLDQFVSTIPLQDYEPKGRLRSLRQLTGILALLHSCFPDSQNSAYLKGLLAGVAERSNVSNRLHDELEVLDNKKPGVLYLNVIGEGYARLPNPNQSKDEFFLTLKREGIPIVYISSADWIEPNILSSPVRKEIPTISIGLEKREVLSRWGEVFCTNPVDREALFAWLNERLCFQDVDTYFDLLVSYANNVSQKQLDVPVVFLPPTLPDHHNLSPLAAIGVIGIELKGDSVRIIIDCKEAGIKSEGADKLMLTGELISKELEFEGISQAFSYTPLHLLLNCAALFPRQSLMHEVLTSNERILERQLIKDWNHRAKRLHVGRIGRDFDTKEKKADSQVLIVLGHKTTFASFVSTSK